MERVVTGEEMKDTVLRHLDGVDAVFKVAAVADFRPRKTFPEKWKRLKGMPAVEWEPTVDILSEVVVFAEYLRYETHLGFHVDLVALRSCDASAFLAAMLERE